MIASAVFTVSAKKPVYSVIGLLANFVCLAGMYLELQAEFLAVIQIVVYSGAILILAGLTLIAITATVVRTPSALAKVPVGTTGEANAFGSVGDFGVALFTTNLLPFEVTAFILMVAVIGVVLIAGDDDAVTGSRRKPRRPGKREPIVKDRVA